MANLTTYSKFYYDYLVTESNQWLDFNDGAGVKAAKIPIGSYTLTTLAEEVAKQMTALSTTRVFSVTIDRDARKYTISATGGTFSLLFSTGANVTSSIYGLLGFNNSDYTLFSTYTGANSTGKVYYPQYLLQNYVDADFNKYPVSAVINRSSSGNAYEVVRFGSNNIYRFEITMTTDLDLGDNGYIKSNPNGLDDLNSFMDYVTNKYPVEFMKDEANSSQFDTIILETTAQSPDGVSYEISPDYGKSLPDFYTLGGPLTFRRVE